MTDLQKLYKGITRAAWGYFFLYFDFNLGNISILPAYIGYILFLSAIQYLKEEEKELHLLLMPVKILIVWHTLVWILKWLPLGIDMNIPFIALIINVINLYFHFQLLTDLSYIARKYQTDGMDLDHQMVTYRTLQTIMLTMITVLLQFSTLLTNWWDFIKNGMGVVYLITGVCLIKVLLDLKKCLPVDFNMEDTMNS